MLEKTKPIEKGPKNVLNEKIEQTKYFLEIPNATTLKNMGLGQTNII